MAQPQRRTLNAAPSWLDLVARIVRETPKLAGAACAGRPALFDGADGPSGPATRGALDLCHSCSALAACRAWAEDLPQAQRPRGVLAGRWTPPHTTRASPRKPLPHNTVETAQSC